MRYIENPHDCPVTRAMSIFGGKWKPIILNCIGDSSLRFGKLNQLMPAISNKVLSNELKELEALGLIERTAFTESSQRVEYTLSNSGKSLMPVLYEIASWGNSNEAKKIVSEMIK
ncbi:helix-turn-helix domain-containing protein [Flavobacterium sp. 123]|jgi:DNA-binding HxlR family transcriptional regulator|uniref:winged helix-turn-helix transcriptional regulator n=1 Tax=Flavobacterium sp. 123 TaxID=2135627 RepID=UPI000EAF0D53|nr:helix-turn-helix domain-containing protein [Flavobacterium sp. 123]RKS99487.1 HxlR family transcriptional regulator [Flavobacterium sp. 123]